MSNPVIETIISRRSTRSYAPRQLEAQLLEQIIKAGRYAPSGGNNQTNHFVVIRNAKILRQLKQLVEGEFSRMEVEEGMYKSLASSIKQAQKGGYDFIMGAPTLVIITNKKGYGNAMADAVAAVENMFIAASSLEVGSCYINQLHWLDDQAALRDFLAPYGIDKDQTICCSAVFGYPQKPIPAPLPRSGNLVTYVE